MQLSQSTQYFMAVASIAAVMWWSISNMHSYTEPVLTIPSAPQVETAADPKDENEQVLQGRRVHPLTGAPAPSAPPSSLESKHLGSNEEQPAARAQILLTNYGWNHPNQTKGLTFARSIRSQQLLQGVVNHPWYRNVSWNTVSQEPPNSNISTYVFLDVETCFELNWPNYGADVKGYDNQDVSNNRSKALNRGGPCCQFQRQALAQPIFGSSPALSNTNTRLVLFDCSGSGMNYCCLPSRNVHKTSVASISVTPSQQASPFDIGLPPPAVKPVHLSMQQINDIETCHEASRPLLYTFAGTMIRRSDLRTKLKPLHNDKDVIVVESAGQFHNMTYDQLLVSSKFAGTPRGDNLFSYRFAEAMSAGAIPVVHADDWVLPFTNKLIQWNKCAIVIPEVQINDTIAILSNITAEQSCEMRRCVLTVYKRYLSTPEGTIDGIVKSLEIARNLHRIGGSKRATSVHRPK